MEFVHIEEILMEQDDVVVLIAGQFVNTQQFMSGQPPVSEGQAAGPLDPNSAIYWQ